MAMFVTRLQAATAVSIIEIATVKSSSKSIICQLSISPPINPQLHDSDHFIMFLHVSLMPILDAKTPVSTTPAPPVECPKDYFGSPPECKCYEDNTAYFGNNEVTGSDNPQPSRGACQRSCAQHPTCQFWTWGKGEPTGPCYLKSARENVTPGLSTYVSGSKHCKLPEAQGNYRKRADREQDCMIRCYSEIFPKICCRSYTFIITNSYSWN